VKYGFYINQAWCKKRLTGYQFKRWKYRHKGSEVTANKLHVILKKGKRGINSSSLMLPYLLTIM
jgi:hypothetical protein